MFTKGEYVVYEQKGVCRVEGFEAPDIPGIAKDRTYYVLLPVLQGGKLYVPADSAEGKMRKIISRQEAEELIAHLDQIDPLKASDDKTAEELYKSCMQSYDYTEWIRLIKWHPAVQTQGTEQTAVPYRTAHMRFVRKD